jgi:spermidine synthase
VETVTAPADTVRRPLPPMLAATLVFVASGAVLVLEVVGLRLVGPYIGVTLQTSSSVIGVALAAIAYGAWLGGWLADRIPPRRLLAPALLIGGIATLITLPVVRYAGEVLRGSASGGVLLLTALAVFVPATALSAIPPLVVKLQLGDLRETGRVVGKLSSIGTLGGITATLGTGFLLVATLASSVIIISLGALLIASALALAWYVWRADRSVEQSVPKARVVAAVVGIAGAGLAVTSPDPCDVETAYHCARVVVDQARPTGRTLLLNGAQHSYVDLADPRHLEFSYTRWIAALTDALPPGPIQALHLGGGGFTLPRYVSAARPGSGNTVLEIDGGLVDLDRRRLGVREGPDLSIWVGDARIGLGARPDASADLVVGDAFGHLVVPWHLATRELVEDVRRVLRPGGVYALNMIDYPPLRFARAEVATVAAVFPHIALAAPPEALANREGANFVILAAESPLPLDAVRNRLATDRAPVSLISGPELVRFTDGADVLTDDYAPVDQLLAR